MVKESIMDGFDEMLKLGWTLEDIRQKMTELREAEAVLPKLRYWGNFSKNDIGMHDYEIRFVRKTDDGKIEMYDELNHCRNKIMSKEKAKKIFQEVIDWIDGS
jgi:hypothetical protein